MPTSYPNQKRVIIHRNTPTKGNNKAFLSVYQDTIEEAAQNINKATTFKLYIYLLCNKDGHDFVLSTQDFSDRYGISLKSAKDAVNDLISLGYLVLKEKKTYDFYEAPHMDVCDITPEKEVRRRFRTKSGDILELTYGELVDKIGKENAEIKWREAE